MTLSTVPKEDAISSTSLNRDLGFQALKSTSMEDGVLVIKVHITMDLSKFNWEQHQLFRSYLKMVRTEMLHGQKIEIMWNYPHHEKEIFEMGRDYADLFDMNFIFVAQEVDCQIS